MLIIYPIKIIAISDNSVCGVYNNFQALSKGVDLPRTPYRIEGGNGIKIDADTFFNWLRETKLNSKNKIEKQIKELEDQIKPLQEQLISIRKLESEVIEARIKKAHKGNGDFTLEELCFAAYSRCECGFGMAYPKNVGFNGSWECSAILMGKADRKKMHSSAMPFIFYDVKSEGQPSANGSTTRPQEEKSSLQKAVEIARGGPTPPVMQGFA